MDLAKRYKGVSWTVTRFDQRKRDNRTARTLNGPPEVQSKAHLHLEAVRKPLANAGVQAVLPQSTPLVATLNVHHDFQEGKEGIVGELGLRFPNAVLPGGRLPLLQGAR